MDRFTLIVVGDERSPVRRFQLRKAWLRRGAAALAVLTLVLGAGGFDYWRIRGEVTELAALRSETTEQREQIAQFADTLAMTQSELARVHELERKVRIIANLPGAAASGGDGITRLAPAPGQESVDSAVGLPLGVPVGGPLGLPVGPAGGGLEPGETWGGDGRQGSELRSPGARRLTALHAGAHHMAASAGVRALSLGELLDELEDKRSRLISMPSIWPTRGWLTSRYGARISPFTGKRHHHSGVDIATKEGSPIISPAHGRVTYVGAKGPLGKSVVVDHGYGVRTLYGHISEFEVKAGDEVERGQVLASVGNTGRSTGPHLHYVVEVDGHSRDPLNYIFD